MLTEKRDSARDKLFIAGVLWFAFVVWLVPSLALGQAQPADGPWSGQVVCQLNMQSQGYTRQETQTWTMNGGTPQVQGAFRLFPVTWTAAGQGSVQRSQNGQTF